VSAVLLALCGCLAILLARFARPNLQWTCLLETANEIMLPTGSYVTVWEDVEAAETSSAGLDLWSGGHSLEVLNDPTEPMFTGLDR
jgi:hypothetical protein